MQFKDFEIRPVKSIDGVIDPNRFELVKWYDHEPTSVTNMRTGEKRISTRSCFVVAWLEGDAKESCFELTSVGLRLVENWVDGLDKFIIKWCEMAEVCMGGGQRMKADELYALIGRWRKEMEEVGKMGCVAEMGQVMLELREDMYVSEQKSAGKSGKAIVSAAKRIVKSAKATKRDNISGVFANIDKDGTKHWCVCDGYVGVRFNEPIPLEEADTSKCAPFDMSQVCRMPDNAKELDLPSLAEVKVYAKTNRGTVDRNGSTKPKPMKIDAEIGLWVNPELLINIMECLPDAKAWATTRIGTIYFKADNGDGVLMPVNHREDNE